MTNDNSDAPRALPPARPRVRRAPAAEAATAAPTEPALTKPAPAKLAAESAPEPDPKPKDYDVGYRKPPVHTRFQKGESGNPAGRPKGAKGLNTLVREYMLEKIEVRTAAGTRKLSRIEVLLLRNFEAAANKGNDRMAARLWDAYKAAVPDEAPGAGGASPEQLSATDLAMLEALRLSLLGPMQPDGSDEPPRPDDAPPEPESAAKPDDPPPGRDTPNEAVPDQAPDDKGQAEDEVDYDWDRRIAG